MPCHYFGLAAISSPWLKDRAFAHNVKEMHEIPAVIIDVMRGGPSTGIPSKTEQSDVNIAIYGGHGEAPRVVVAPTSVRDCMFHRRMGRLSCGVVAESGHRSVRQWRSAKP